MNNYRCTNCGLELRRPSQPYSCPQCGRQAVGLFRLAPAGGPGTPGAYPQQPMQPQQPPPSGYPQQPGPGMYPQQPLQPQPPTYGQGMYTPPQPMQPQQPAYPPTGYVPRPAFPTQHTGIPVPPRPVGMPPPPAVPLQPGMPPQSLAPGQPGMNPPAAQPYWNTPAQPQPGMPPGMAQPGMMPPGAYPQVPQQSAPMYGQPQPVIPQQPLAPQQAIPQQPMPQQPPPQPVAPAPVAQPPVAPIAAQVVSETPPAVATPPQAPPSPPMQAPAAPRAVPPQAARPQQPLPKPPTRPQPPAEPPAAREQPREKAPAKPVARLRTPPAGQGTVKPVKAVPKGPSRPKVLRPEQFVWAYPEQPPLENEARPVRHAPVVDAEGNVFLHIEGKLVGLSAKDDKVKVQWEYPTNSYAPGPVVLGEDHNLRLHTGDGYLHCVSTAGRQIWSPALVGEPLGWAVPLVDAAGNTWIHGYEGGLTRVDPEGRPARQPFFRTRQRFDCPGLLYGDVLYTGSEDGYVFAIDLSQPKGKNLWDHTAGLGTTGWFVNRAPLLVNNQLVVAAGDEHLYAFHLDGKPAWKCKLPGQLMSAPVADAQGNVYAGVSQARRGQAPTGALVAVDGNSHKIRWEYAAAAIESTPVIGDDETLYFGDNDGTIHAVDFRGKGRWKGKVESAVRSAGTLVGPQRVAFGQDDETLVVLACSSNGLAEGGWPKIARTLGQAGRVG